MKFIKLTLSGGISIWLHLSEIKYFYLENGATTVSLGSGSCIKVTETPEEILKIIGA